MEYSDYPYAGALRPMRLFIFYRTYADGELLC